MKTSRTPRRHGAELESALLDAAWDELVERGYARLTMGAVATRANTSEPVLYRRWANKNELVLAAFDHYRANHPIPTPDTGELRGDLLAQLSTLSEALAGFYAIAAGAAFSGLSADTGLSPKQLRARAVGVRLAPHRRAIYRRAAGRGELDLERVPDAVLALPFDLLRHDLLMDLKPLRPARIRSIVDDIFLPLVRAHS